VQIARAVLDRSKQRDVYEVDDGASLNHVIEAGVGVFVDLLTLDDGHVGLGQGGEKRIDIDVFTSVTLDEIADLRFERKHRADPAAGELTQPVDRRKRLRLGHRHRDRAVYLKQRQRPQPLGFVLPDEFEQRRVDQAVTQLHAADPERFAEGVHQLPGAD